MDNGSGSKHWPEIRVIPRVHVVTDDSVLRRGDFHARAKEILDVGFPVAFHIRAPQATGDCLVGLAAQLRNQKFSSGTKILVNDRVDVALCINLDGVHIGNRSLLPTEVRALLGPDSLLGVSVHGVEEAVEAVQGGADFLFVGAIWETLSHPGGIVMGLDLIRDVKAAISVPIVGIGGVTPALASSIIDAGGHGIAAIRGIWDAPSSGHAVQAYFQALG